jgi:hypothetical protein
MGIEWRVLLRRPRDVISAFWTLPDCVQKRVYKREVIACSILCDLIAPPMCHQVAQDRETFECVECLW